MTCLSPTPLSTFSATVINPLADVRLDLASKLLAITSNESLLSTLTDPLLLYFQQHMCGNYYAYPSLASTAPALTAQASALVAGTDFSLPGLMAGMLLQPAYEWLGHRDIGEIPLQVLEAYIKWRLAPPPVFERIGDADVYSRYLEQTVAAFYDAIAGSNPHPQAHGINVVFHRYLTLTQVYFSEGYHAKIIRQRSVLVEMLCLAEGLPVLHGFMDRPAGGKIRVGIIAGAYQATAEGYYVVSRIENFPRDQFEITLYYEHDNPTEFQEFCFSLADRVVRIPDASTGISAVEAIRADDLDIIIIAANVTSILNSTTRAVTFRLARLQMEIGTSPMSTGFTTCDLFLSAALNETGDAQTGYSEELCLLDGMMNYYACQHDHDAQTIFPSRADLKVPAEAVLFVSSSNYYKLVPELTTSWARILAEVPNSYLLIMPYGAAWGQFFPDQFMARLHTEFSACGISPDRILIQEPVPTRADIKALVALGDVYLDSYPFTGACSLICPLETRTPIVARAGIAFRSRFAAGMLRFAGLDAMVASTQAEYERIAITLGTDTHERAKARQQMLDVFAQGLPYFDDRNFSHKMEQALSAIWARRQAVQASLAAMPADRLKNAITTLSRKLVHEGNHFMRALNQRELVRLLHAPGHGEETLSLDPAGNGLRFGGDGPESLRFPSEDSAFLSRVLAMLESFQPARDREWTRLGLGTA